MDYTFENTAAELHEKIIALCMEAAQVEVDEAFAYIAISRDALLFNAFYKKGGNVIPLHKANPYPEVIKQFLSLGSRDAEELKGVFEKYSREVPAEIKLHYIVKRNAMDFLYRYSNEVDFDAMGGQVNAFLEWRKKNSL